MALPAVGHQMTQAIPLKNADTVVKPSASRTRTAFFLFRGWSLRVARLFLNALWTNVSHNN